MKDEPDPDQDPEFLEAYKAGCWCGWEGEVRRQQEQARLDAVEHSAKTGHQPPE